MKRKSLILVCSAAMITALFSAGCGSSSGAQSAAAEDYSTGEAAASSEEETAEAETKEAADTAVSRAARRSGRSTLADRVARAAEEAGEDEQTDISEEDTSSEDEEVSDDEYSGDDEDEWGPAEYTYHLNTKSEWDWVDSDDGMGIIMSLSLQYLEIEQEYDSYGREVSENGITGVKKAIEEVNGMITDDNEAFRSEYLDMAQERYDTLSEEDGDYYYGGFANEETLTVARADSHCLSVVRDHYQNLSGAHGYTLTTAYTYDAKTGIRLEAEDFVTSIDPLADLIAQELLKTHDPMEFNDVSEESAETDLMAAIQKLMNGDEYYEGDNDLHYVTWYPVNGGITFVFNQYDLGPYAAGQFICTLIASDYPDLFQEEYLYGPEDYAKTISLYEGYDVDGQELLIGEYEDSEQTVETVQIDYGDEELVVEVWGYDVKAYLMTVRAGKFLYLDVSGDNDWHNIYAIELGNGELEAVEMQGLGFLTDPVDPNHVMLVTRTQMLSTFSIKRSYRLDAAGGGELIPNESMYQIIRYDENSPTFTMKQDAELNILDDIETGKTHVETVEKGTNMEVIRTDNESISDCRAEDGRIIRFTVDTSEWPYMIDGEYEVEDLLDGTVYVG